MKEEIPVVDLRTDGGTCHRPIEDDVVSRYAGMIKKSTKFPRILVVQDEDKNYWLCDGFDRLAVYKKLKRNTIPASLEPGTKREALFMSFSANKSQGLSRQKQTVKEMLLEKVFPGEQWYQESKHGLAEWIGVTHSYISRIRRQYNKSVYSTHSRQSKTKQKKQKTWEAMNEGRCGDE